MSDVTWGGCGVILPGGVPCDTQVQCVRCMALSRVQYESWLFRHGHSIRTPRFARDHQAMRDKDHAAAIEREHNYAQHGMSPS